LAKNFWFPDTVLALAKAYLATLNKLVARRARGNLEPIAVGERRIHSTDAG
jgi:hypothetical protein